MFKNAFKGRGYKAVIGVALVVLGALLLAQTIFAVSDNANAASSHTRTATVWLQTLDSCRQAIPGARFKLTGNGQDMSLGPTTGSGPVSVTSSGGCPVQYGNCQLVSTGCISLHLIVPSSGSVTYKIKETSAPKNYMYCTGGSVCPGGAVYILVTVNSHGNVIGYVHNTYPDGVKVVWPTIGSYSGKITDPFVVHNFQIGNGSCDGDQDADDHLTGSPSSHCDSDKD